MFFDESYEYTIVEDISLEELEERCGVLRQHPTNTKEGRWALFSYLKGLEDGLNEMYAINFGYNISSFVAGMGVDAGTDVYFSLKMDDRIFEIFEESRNSADNEPDQIRLIFINLLKFYHEEASEYEVNVYRTSMRLSSDDKDFLEKGDGTLKDSLLELIRNYKDDVPENIIVKPGNLDKRIDLSFTYTEMSLIESLPGDTVPLKLQGLIRWCSDNR